MITILLIIMVVAAFMVIASGVWVSIALAIAITGQRSMHPPQNAEGKAEVRC
jgi:MFS superfamily sulfate permease-like transporter